MDIFGWGFNLYGQLGNCGNNKHQLTPIKIYSFLKK
jgi:hypothetical protein